MAFVPLFSIPGRRASCPWSLLKPLQLLINGSQLLSHFHNALLHPLDDVSRSPLNEARHLELSLLPLADEGELSPLLLEALTLLVDVRGGKGKDDLDSGKQFNSGAGGPLLERSHAHHLHPCQLSQKPLLLGHSVRQGGVAKGQE